MSPPARRLLVTIVMVGSVACDRGTATPPAPLDSPPSASPSGDDACPAPDVDGVAVVLFEDAGGCLPGDVMVLYRCAATTEPVLRLSSKTGPVAFLGGMFAVRSTTLPANVRFAGRAGDMEVLIADPPVPGPTETAAPTPSSSPSEGVEPSGQTEPLIYVRHDGITERWLRLERRRVLDEPPTAWLIGDSILDGGREEVEAALAGWSATIDAEVGRPSSAGVALALEAATIEPDLVLVELGTNDSSPSDFRTHLVETLEALRDVPLVIWQTVRGPDDDPTFAAVNLAIREAAPNYPNAAVADWETFVPPEAVEVDGIHPDPGFEHLESELLTPLLSAWRDAMSGDGATSCGPRVVRATS